MLQSKKKKKAELVFRRQTRLLIIIDFDVCEKSLQTKQRHGSTVYNFYHSTWNQRILDPFQSIFV